jgi:hypothetical protein
MIGLRNLLSVKTSALSRRGRRGGEGGELTVPAFITPATLVTFPVATLSIKVVLFVLGVSESRFWVIITSFIVGGLIYLIGYQSGLGRREQAIGFGIAVLNCFFIAASVLGFGELIGAPPTAPPTGS